jgi:hypothetical protein
MATLGFIMFVTGDDQLSFDADYQNKPMAAAPIPDTFEEDVDDFVVKELDDESSEELSFVQASSSWMWDRSDKARKRMGLPPKYSYKPNPTNRAQRIRKIAASIVHEAASHTRTKIGHVSASISGAGMSMSNFQHTSDDGNKDPFAALMHVASLNEKETKWRDAKALKFVRKVVDNLAMKMIQRARAVKAPKVVLSQWMWDSPKSKAREARHASHRPLAELKRLARYDQRKMARHLGRIAQKVVDEAELEQKGALVQGTSLARQRAVMSIAMVNTYSYLRVAKAKVLLQLKAFLKKMSKAMVDHVALAHHANKLRKRRQAKAKLIKKAIAKHKAQIAFMKKAIRTAKGRGRRTLRKALAIHRKKLSNLRRAHTAQLRKVSKAADFIPKKGTKKADFIRKFVKRATKKMVSHVSHKKAAKKHKRAPAKALRKATIAAAIKGTDAGDKWGAKKEVNRRADCLQEGDAIACASERIRH